MPSITKNAAEITSASPTGALTHAIRIALALSPLLLTLQIVSAQDVDLGNLGDRGFRIDGIDAGDSSGWSVSGAGDVNGDGLADLIIGAPNTELGIFTNSGESYIVFGKADAATVNLEDLGADGFQITGNRGEETGSSVSGAGDVNGDGLDDLIVGAPSSNRAGTDAGSSYVVFGKADSLTVDVNVLGSGGFRIDGIDPGDYSGRSVSGAGDVNGDGLADLIVGAPYAGFTSILGSRGESYVVFGKGSNSAVDLANLGSGGFRIEGDALGDFSGRGVAGAGDVNGDGLADLIVGAPFADPGGDDDAGESYVVFGKADSSAVDLAALGSGGFRIDGIDEDDFSGTSVSGAGDVNNDGLADLIVGAPGGDPGGDSGAGESYVVFGKASPTTVDLADLGASGFRINGVDAGDVSGRSVSGAGDVNGDGLADLIVGALGADPGGDSDAGESYVVFGKAGSSTVDLATLGAGGFQIDGIDAGDFSGTSVSGAGDVNGDGLADLLIGARLADPGGDFAAGESYVVFSASSPLLSATYRVRNRNGNPPRMAVGITGDGSNDGTPDGRFWIDFADGADLLTAASTEIVTLTRSDGAFAASAADVSWRLQTTREDWTSAEITVRYLDSELLIANENALEIVFSPNGSAPFTPLSSTVNPQNNTITATITEPGFLYIGEGDIPDDLFGDRFEATSR